MLDINGFKNVYHVKRRNKLNILVRFNAVCDVFPPVEIIYIYLLYQLSDTVSKRCLTRPCTINNVITSNLDSLCINISIVSPSTHNYILVSFSYWLCKVLFKISYSRPVITPVWPSRLLAKNECRLIAITSRELAK